MATEYKLSYTGQEIDERLGKAIPTITQTTPFIVTDERAKTVSLVGEAETEYKYSVLSETIRSYKDTTISYAYMTEEPYLYGKRYVKNADAPTSWTQTYVQMKFDNLNVGQEYTLCIDSRKAGNLFTNICVYVYDDTNYCLNGTSAALYYYARNQDKMYTANFTIPEGHAPYVNVRLYPRGESTNVIFDNVYINRANTDNLYHTERIEEYGTFTEKKDFENIVKGAEYSTIPECNGVITLDLMKEKNIPISRFQGKTMVCFGDSITGNYSSPTDYPSIITQNTGMTVYNCGFGGCRMGVHSTDGYDAFSMYKLADAITTGDFAAQDYAISNGANMPNIQEHLNTLKAMDWANVDYISIAYGTNDIQGGNAVDNAENPLDTSTYLGAFRYSIEKIMMAYPHIKILALTPIYRFYPDTGEDSDSTLYTNNKKFTEWVDGLIQAAGELKIPCVDMYRTLCINKYNRTLYFPADDGTHPNSIGRKVMGEKIVARLNSEF